MTRKKDRLISFLEADSEHERLGNIGTALNNSYTPIEFTPHAARFLLWLLEHDCSAQTVARAIDTATLDFDPNDESEDHRREFEETYKIPDPISVLKSIKTMQTIRLSFDHALALAQSLAVAPALVAQEVLGMSENEATTAKVLSEDGPIAQLLNYFFTEDETLHKDDSMVVYAQTMHIAMLMLEMDLSAAHAASALHRLSSVRSKIMGGPGRLERPGRNDPCLCDSGRKYKKCHKKEREG